MPNHARLPMCIVCCSVFVVNPKGISKICGKFVHSRCVRDGCKVNCCSMENLIPASVHAPANSTLSEAVIDSCILSTSAELSVRANARLSAVDDSTVDMMDVRVGPRDQSPIDNIADSVTKVTRSILAPPTFSYSTALNSKSPPISQSRSARRNLPVNDTTPGLSCSAAVRSTLDIIPRIPGNENSAIADAICKLSIL